MVIAAPRLSKYCILAHQRRQYVCMHKAASSCVIR